MTKENLLKIYFSEFEVIDRLNQHKDGLTFEEWLKKNKEKYDKASRS